MKELRSVHVLPAEIVQHSTGRNSEMKLILLKAWVCVCVCDVKWTRFVHTYVCRWVWTGVGFHFRIKPCDILVAVDSVILNLGLNFC